MDYTNCNVLQCWSSDGYHLWMLRRASNGSHNPDHMTQEEDDHTCSTNNEDSRPPTSISNKKDSNMEILVMQFLKNSIVNNPIIVSAHSIV